ncbi:MAG TPA: hypothetical protein VF656_18870 [Pyrinomonadaceae bacterium]|jgi:hypothetical protein
MTYAKNMLIGFYGESGLQYEERLLKADPGEVIVVTIRMDDPHALPEYRRRSDLDELLSDGRARIHTVDKYQKLLARPEETFSEDRIKERDERWSLVEPLLAQEYSLFEPNTRGPIIAAHSVKTGIRKETLYNLVRYYWQRGQMKNALIRITEKGGWRNRDDSIPHPVKLGRPPKLNDDVGDGGQYGINIDRSVRQRFRWALKGYYLCKPRKAKTLRRCYKMMLGEFFRVGTEFDRDGVEVPVLPDDSELPTYAQFIYWYHKEFEPRKIYLARHGEREYNLVGRPLIGDTRQLAFGPRSLYQIDAFIGDIYLVSSFDPTLLIGRPVAHLVVDTFSHMIAGFSVTLEGPNWTGAMLALENAFTDKVEFCAQYGVTIDKWEWPCEGLCDAIHADRGEVEGHNADNLAHSLGIRVQNTPPYRPDLKGMVEKYIDVCTERAIRWVPGAVRRRNRGDRDYRLDALLDIHQFRKMMIYVILEHNLETRLTQYRFDEFMIADKVEPYPIDLWNWGLSNRSGLPPQTPDRETLRLNLLPEMDASVTPAGIKVGNLYYTSDRAEREHWFDRVGGRKNWKLKVACDLRDMACVYLRPPVSTKMEVCHLLKKDETFIGRDYYEVAEEFARREKGNRRSVPRANRAAVKTQARLDKVLAEAERIVLPAREAADLSKAEIVAGVRPNRAAEREAENARGAWSLGEAGGNTPTRPETATGPEDGAAASSSMDAAAVVDEVAGSAAVSRETSDVAPVYIPQRGRAAQLRAEMEEEE